MDRFFNWIDTCTQMHLVFIDINLMLWGVSTAFLGVYLEFTGKGAKSSWIIIAKITENFMSRGEEIKLKRCEMFFFRLVGGIFFLKKENKESIQQQLEKRTDRLKASGDCTQTPSSLPTYLEDPLNKKKYTFKKEGGYIIIITAGRWKKLPPPIFLLSSRQRIPR